MPMVRSQLVFSSRMKFTPNRGRHPRRWILAFNATRGDNTCPDFHFYIGFGSPWSPSFWTKRSFSEKSPLRKSRVISPSPTPNYLTFRLYSITPKQPKWIKKNFSKSTHRIPLAHCCMATEILCPISMIIGINLAGGEQRRKPVVHLKLVISRGVSC